MKLIKIKQSKARFQNITNIGLALSCVFLGLDFFSLIQDIFYYVYLPWCLGENKHNSYEIKILMLEHLILFSSILIAIIYDLNQEGWDKTIYITESKINIRAWLLFIISEALFFFSLFWTYIYQIFVRSIWIGFVWPPVDFNMINPLLIPTLNTFILIWSSLEINRTFRDIKTSLIKYTFYDSINHLSIAILCGIIFLLAQYEEYSKFILTFNDSLYGSIFYLATGFHGLHVLIGTIWLFICWNYCIFKVSTPHYYINLQMSIIYWHFVDLVWIVLYLIIYLTPHIIKLFY